MGRGDYHTAVSGDFRGCAAQYRALFIGWASGWTLVLAAAWTNDALAKLNRPALSVAVYGGTGTGILLCGLAAIGIQGLSLTASQGWWIYGAAALLFSLYVSRYLPRPGN